MPNQSLIEGLENLLETYNQHRRSTDGLLRGLKGANNALAKARRSLDEYVEQNVNLDGKQLDQTQQSMGTIQFREEIYDVLQLDLRRESKSLANQIKAFKDAIAALQGDMVDLIKLDRAYKVFQDSPLQDDDLQALMPELEYQVEQAQSRLGDEFGAALRDALAELGIEIAGRPPRFEIGRYEIMANFVNRSAAISYGKSLIVPRVKLSLETLLKAYQKEVKTIEQRNEEGASWMKQFYIAWNNVQVKSGKKSGRVNIVDCYYELVLLRQKRNFYSVPSKRSFVDYSRAQFAYDFFEFTHRQRISHNNLFVAAHTATKSQADSPGRSMWIVEGSAPHDGRYVSDIAFVED